LYLDGSLHSAELKDVIRRTEKKNNSIEIKRDREIKKREQDKFFTGEELEKRLDAKSRLNDEELSTLVPIKIADIIKDRVSTGTITIKTNRKELNARQIYSIYKQRQAIEQFFKTYDNTLGYDSSYMRSDYSFEAWLFINHLCMMMSMDAMREISNIDVSKNISLDDLIKTLRKIKVIKIDDKWYLSKFSNYVTNLCEKLDISFESQEITD
jgi:IS4 transposase